MPFRQQLWTRVARTPRAGRRSLQEWPQASSSKWDNAVQNWTEIVCIQFWTFKLTAAGRAKASVVIWRKPPTSLFLGHRWFPPPKPKKKKAKKPKKKKKKISIVLFSPNPVYKTPPIMPDHQNLFLAIQNTENHAPDQEEEEDYHCSLKMPGTMTQTKKKKKKAKKIVIVLSKYWEPCPRPRRNRKRKSPKRSRHWWLLPSK